LAEFLLDHAQVARVVYLGGDDALDQAVALRSHSLVGANDGPGRLWERAFPLALAGSPDEIEGFLRNERARSRLRNLETLAHPAVRTVEIVGDQLAILAHARAAIDADDIFAASFLCYGNGDAPSATLTEERWFLTPGPLGPAGGAAVLEETEASVVATFYSADAKVLRKVTLALSRRANVQVRRKCAGKSAPSRLPTALAHSPSHSPSPQP
jgi:hypothetical protein